MVQKVEPEIIGIVTTDNPEFKFKVSIKSQPWPIQINQLIQYCPLPFQHKWYDAMIHFLLYWMKGIKNVIKLNCGAK